MLFFNENNNKITHQLRYFVLVKEVTPIRPSDLDLTELGHARVGLGIRRSGRGVIAWG